MQYGKKEPWVVVIIIHVTPTDGNALTEEYGPSLPTHSFIIKYYMNTITNEHYITYAAKLSHTCVNQILKNLYL